MHRDGEWFENKTTTKSGEVFCTNIMMCRMSVKFHFFTFQLRMCSNCSHGVEIKKLNAHMIYRTI